MRVVKRKKKINVKHLTNTAWSNSRTSGRFAPCIFEDTVNYQKVVSQNYFLR